MDTTTPRDGGGECRDARLTRRTLLRGGAGIGAAWALLPRVAAASAGARDPRFLFVLLRGALDGLGVLPAIGDPAYEAARGPFELEGAAVVPIDGLFALNGNMPTLAGLFRAGEALAVHAVGTPYRDRSHFDGQSVLETGTDRPGGGVGWLNRAVANLADAGSVRLPRGLSVGTQLPLIAKGDAPFVSWSRDTIADVDDDTARRLLALYEARDPDLALAFAEGTALGADLSAMGAGGGQVADFADAGRLLAQPEGPRIGTLSTGGWDTHVRAEPTDGRLGVLLKKLDDGIAALKTEMAPVWGDTVVVLATEFGRTVAINGSSGTDHGQGSAMIVLGGAVRGGRVLGAWPGLAPAALYDGRDLRPTTDLRAVLAGLLAEHVGLDRRVLAAEVFPGLSPAGILSGLVSA
jgi:uncharacterized protein (DUF1501 family)